MNSSFSRLSGAATGSRWTCSSLPEVWKLVISRQRVERSERSQRCSLGAQNPLAKTHRHEPGALEQPLFLVAEARLRAGGERDSVFEFSLYVFQPRIAFR